jgi:photoactive yellow protein
MNLPAPIDFNTLELLPYGVIVVNAEGVVLFYNQREEQIADRKREHVLGRNFFTEVAPCTQVAAFHGRFVETMVKMEECAGFHFVFPFARGPRHVQISFHPFVKEAERLCLISVADLTERETVRDQILRNQRFSELGEVAASVAHNFNNLLMVIQMGSELASLEAPPAIKKQLDRVLLAVGDGTALVARFRAIAQSGRQERQQPLDVHASVALAVAFGRTYATQMLQADGRQVDLEYSPWPEPIEILGDPVELREVVLNLLRNAVDAIAVSGLVQIRTAVEDGLAVLEVSDNGCGMSLAVQERIFTPMFTTKGDKGTGLGLASAFAAIRRVGGSISVASAEGRGSRFRIEMPRT